jgi:hypothetical protein
MRRWPQLIPGRSEERFGSGQHDEIAELWVLQHAVPVRVERVMGGPHLSRFLRGALQVARPPRQAGTRTSRSRVINRVADDFVGPDRTCTGAINEENLSYARARVR